MYKLIGFLLLLVAYNAAHPGDRAEITCSIKLNEMLALVCENVGYNPIINKRSGSLDLFDYVDNNNRNSDDDRALSNDVMPYPLVDALLKSFYRENSLTQTRRRQRGVADECCKQSCSPSELLSYCRSPKIN